jgi:hypothetical protein
MQPTGESEMAVGRQPVTMGGEPPPAVLAFGDGIEERRRDRRRRLWAATVEIRDDSFSGRILDFAPAPRQLEFGSPVGGRGAVSDLLTRLDRLGAPLLWRREDATGLQLLFAPRELATRLRGTLPPLMGFGLGRAEGAAEAAPRRRAMGGHRLALAAIGSAVVIALALVLFSLRGGAATGRAGDPGAPLSVMAGAVDQHSCPHLLGRLSGATNQIDFSLHAAAAAQSKCIDLGNGGASDLDGRMVQATKVH